MLDCPCLPAGFRARSIEGRGSIFVAMWLGNIVEADLSNHDCQVALVDGRFHHQILVRKADGETSDLLTSPGYVEK